MHPREAIKKRLWQATAAAALLHGVLRAKDAEAGRAGKCLAQLRDEHLRSVVQQGVQALQHALTWLHHIIQCQKNSLVKLVKCMSAFIQKAEQDPEVQNAKMPKCHNTTVVWGALHALTQVLPSCIRTP